MNIGRNDPCPCGSGKKYKKCCLAKDEEQARNADQKEKPERPRDLQWLAGRARWEEFESAEYESRIALFTRTLDEPALMDGEMAVEMLRNLFEQAAERDERDRFDALTESLRERLPEVYDKEEAYVIEWRVINALAQRSHEISPSFTGDLARLADIDIDKWNRVEGRLAYHGHLTTLVEAMRLAWPEVRKSVKIVPWGIDEFSFRAVQYEMMNYATQTPTPDLDDPVLHERIEHYYGKNYSRDQVAHLIDILIGKTDQEWTVNDFNLPPPEKKSDDDWNGERDSDEEEQDEREGDEEEWDEEDGAEIADERDRGPKPVKAPHPAETNLRDLAIQFLRYAHDREGIAYSKAELARNEMLRFIRRRQSGELEYRESMLDAMLRGEGMSRKPIKKYKAYKHVLVPDRERFEFYLSNLFQVWSSQPHRAAALLELTPAWLRFLQSGGLVDEDLRQRTLRDLEPLTGDLLKVYRGSYNDPALSDAMERWIWNAGKEPASAESDRGRAGETGDGERF